MHARWQSSAPCSQGCCTYNLQTLTIAGNEHPDVEALSNGVVNVLLSPCQQNAIQDLHATNAKSLALQSRALMYGQKHVTLPIVLNIKAVTLG